MPDKPEILRLKWNNHNSTFLETLSTLRDSEMFVDVTLACEGRLFPAHQFVLATCSEFFNEMFSKNPCKHPIVYLKDVPEADLKALLNFMYCGEVSVAETSLASLMNTAEGLKVKGLALPDRAKMLRTENFAPPHPRPPPPDPTDSPPLKRKRYPAMNKQIFDNNIHNHLIPESNSPYDLSQKSSSTASSVSQSDVTASERPHSASPPDAKHPTSSTPSQNHDSEALTPQSSLAAASNITFDEERVTIKTESSLSPRTPQAASSSGISDGRDSRASHDEDGNIAGPSGMYGEGNSINHKPDDETMERDEVKVDVDDSWDCSAGGGDSRSGCGGSDAGGGIGWDSVAGHDGGPPSNSDSVSNFAAFDPALKDLSSKPRGEKGNSPATTTLVSPRSISTPAPPESTSIVASLLQPRPLWHQDGNVAEEMLSCPICGKLFPKKRKSNLQVHLRTHTNERPFKCNTCNRCFKQKAHLEKHQEKSCHVLSEFVPYPFFPKMHE